MKGVVSRQTQYEFPKAFSLGPHVIFTCEEVCATHLVKLSKLVEKYGTAKSRYQEHGETDRHKHNTHTHTDGQI